MLLSQTVGDLSSKLKPLLHTPLGRQPYQWRPRPLCGARQGITFPGARRQQHMVGSFGVADLSRGQIRLSTL